MKIRWWYDRFTRCWVVQVLDNNGYEIKSEYCGSKEDLEFVVDALKIEYDILDARKYKRGE